MRRRRATAGGDGLRLLGGTPAARRHAGDGRGLAVPIRGRFACNLAASAIDACAEGLGFGRFLSYQVESLVAAKKLPVVLRDFEPDPIPIHVVFAHAKLLSPRVRAFVDWLRANL